MISKSSFSMSLWDMYYKLCAAFCTLYRVSQKEIHIKSIILIEGDKTLLFKTPCTLWLCFRCLTWGREESCRVTLTLRTSDSRPPVSSLPVAAGWWRAATAGCWSSGTLTPGRRWVCSSRWCLTSRCQPWPSILMIMLWWWQVWSLTAR